MRFYHLTLISPKGDVEPLEPEGSPLAALWHIRKTLREEPLGSVGIVSEAEPRRTLYKARVVADRFWLSGKRVDTAKDRLLHTLPREAQAAILAAVDAFDGDEPDERLFAAVALALWKPGRP